MNLNKLAFVIGVSLSGNVFSDTITTNYSGVSPGSTAVIRNTVSPTVASTNVYAGVYNHTVVSSSPNGIDLSPIGPQFVSFCIDIVDYVGSGVVYTLTDLMNSPDPILNNMGSEKATDLSKLLFFAVGSELSNVLSLTNNQAAALQMAVWEVVFEQNGGYNVTNGNFTALNATTQNQANFYLNGISTATEGMQNLIALTNPDKQDFIAQSTVPIPAAAWLFATGLIGIGAVSRRKS